MPKLGKSTTPLKEPKPDRIKTGGGNGGYNHKTVGGWPETKGRKTPRDYHGNRGLPTRS